MRMPAFERVVGNSYIGANRQNLWGATGTKTLAEWTNAVGPVSFDRGSAVSRRAIQSHFREMPANSGVGRFDAV
jgi:hypothetical protein